MCIQPDLLVNDAPLIGTWVWVHQAHVRGLAGARNTGLNTAEGLHDTETSRTLTGYHPVSNLDLDRTLDFPFILNSNLESTS